VDASARFVYYFKTCELWISLNVQNVTWIRLS
jgi:hypothetical protein